MIESSWMKLKNVPLGLRPEGFYGQLQMQMIFEEFSITKEEGTTFPGGHVERDETFTESVIREVSEETGLVIENPKLCGIYHWFMDAVVELIHEDRFSECYLWNEEGCWKKRLL